MKQPCTTKLTRADTRALWHAVKAQGEMVAVRLREGFTLEQLGPERDLTCAARTALRKVNAIRKTQASARGRKAGGGAEE